MALDRYKILSSVYALDSFTVDDIVSRSGVSRSTVRSWFARDNEWIQEAESLPVVKHGRRPKRWRLRADRAQDLASLLKDLWGRVARDLGQELVQEGGGPDFDNDDAFNTADAYISAAVKEKQDDLIVEYADMAKAWINSRIEALEDWSKTGYEIPNSVWARVEKIYLKADRIAWNIDAFVAAYRDMGVSDIAQVVSSAFESLASVEDQSAASAVLPPIRWRPDVDLEMQFGHAFSLLYGETEYKVNCSLLIVLARIKPGQNFIRDQLIACIDNIGPEAMASSLDAWTSSSDEPHWTNEELVAVLTGIAAHRALVAEKLIGNWAGRVWALPSISMEVRVRLEMILGCSSEGGMRQPLVACAQVHFDVLANASVSVASTDLMATAEAVFEASNSLSPYSPGFFRLALKIRDEIYDPDTADKGGGYLTRPIRRMMDYFTGADLGPQSSDSQVLVDAP